MKSSVIVVAGGLQGLVALILWVQGFPWLSGSFLISANVSLAGAAIVHAIEGLTLPSSLPVKSHFEQRLRQARESAADRLFAERQAAASKSESETDS